MLPGAIHHIALRVSDLERAQRFYSALLGLPEERRLGADTDLRAIWLRAGDARLMLERVLRGGGPTEGSGHVLVLAVDNLDRWEKRLCDHGVTIADRTQHTLYCSDPDGHRVGLTVYPAQSSIV